MHSHPLRCTPSTSPHVFVAAFLTASPMPLDTSHSQQTMSAWKARMALICSLFLLQHLAHSRSQLNYSEIFCRALILGDPHLCEATLGPLSEQQALAVRCQEPGSCAGCQMRWPRAAQCLQRALLTGCSEPWSCSYIRAIQDAGQSCPEGLVQLLLISSGSQRWGLDAKLSEVGDRRKHPRRKR